MRIILCLVELTCVIEVKVWVVMPCSIAVGYQRFGGPCCFHLHSEDGSINTTRHHNSENLDLKHHTAVKISKLSEFCNSDESC
jgi:hypothetical protein